MKKVLTFKIYGQSLAECREKAGLTQEQLGEKIGYSRTTINGWEKKTTVKVDEDVLKRLEKALDVTSNVLTDVPRGAEKKPDSEEIKLLKENVVTLNRYNNRLEKDVERLTLELEQCRASSGDIKKE